MHPSKLEWTKASPVARIAHDGSLVRKIQPGVPSTGVDTCINRSKYTKQVLKGEPVLKPFYLCTWREILYPLRNLKGGVGSLFDPCVNVMGWQPYCPSRAEVSYSAICTHYCYRVIHRTITYLHA